MSYSKENLNSNHGRSHDQDTSETSGNLAAGAPKEEAPVRVDGFAQVLAMLKIADNEFRQSLLKRLGARDPELAHALRSELRKMDDT